MLAMLGQSTRESEQRCWISLHTKQYFQSPDGVHSECFKLLTPAFRFPQAMEPTAAPMPAEHGDGRDGALR